MAIIYFYTIFCFNPFHINPLAVVCGTGGGEADSAPLPLISQPLMELEGCFFLVSCASIKDLSIEKRILKVAQKIRPGAAKMLQRHSFSLNFAKICFYNFEVIFGHNSLTIGEIEYFCIRTRKLK